MDSDQKYIEALNRAIAAYKDEDKHLKATLERIFPELKDEVDELTWLINYISEEAYCLSVDIRDDEDRARLKKLQKSLAWLKKQESYYTFEIKEGHWYKCVCDYMLNGSNLMFKNGRLYYCRSNWRLSSEIDERNVKDIGVNGYKSFFRPATNQEIEDWLKKQSKNNTGISESTKQKLEDNLNNALEKETPESWNEFLDKRSDQKHEWSKEDENGLEDALWAVKQARTIAKDENDMGTLWYAERWLNTIKDKMGG